MTQDEVSEYVVLVLASWPAAPTMDATALQYERGLCDLDKRVAWTALQRLQRTCRRLPSVAEIRQEARKLSHPETERPAELAWEIVLEAVRRRGWPRPPTWKDPAIARAVRAVGGWQQLCDSRVRDHGVLRAQFRDAYRAAQAQRAEQLTLPPALRAPRQLTEVSDDEFEDRTCSDGRSGGIGERAAQIGATGGAA